MGKVGEHDEEYKQLFTSSSDYPSLGSEKAPVIFTSIFCLASLYLQDIKWRYWSLITLLPALISCDPLPLWPAYLTLNQDHGQAHQLHDLLQGQD